MFRWFGSNEETNKWYLDGVFFIESPPYLFSSKNLHKDICKLVEKDIGWFETDFDEHNPENAPQVEFVFECCGEIRRSVPIIRVKPSPDGDQNQPPRLVEVHSDEDFALYIKGETLYGVYYTGFLLRGSYCCPIGKHLDILRDTHTTVVFSTILCNSCTVEFKDKDGEITTLSLMEVFDRIPRNNIFAEYLTFKRNQIAGEKIKYQS